MPATSNAKEMWEQGDSILHAPVVAGGKKVPLPALDVGAVVASGIGEAVEALLIGAPGG